MFFSLKIRNQFLNLQKIIIKPIFEFMRSFNCVILCLCIIFPMLIKSQVSNTSINESEFYNAFSSTNVTLIDNQITILQKKDKDGLKAYIGALKMKKAGIVFSVLDKLSFFKEGRLLLEEEITKFPNNAEYRFLRLVIQENSPQFLGYNTNLNEDKKSVIQEYKKMIPSLQNQIKKYCLTSKILTLKEIQ